MSVPPQTRLTEEERANLVAFLDGEVEQALAQKMEEKVARSPSVRKEVEALEKTWTMLDWLPRPEVPADFASQTITRIHSQQLHVELVENRLMTFLTVAAKSLAWVALILTAVVIGYGTVRLAWPDPSAELIEHLEIIENMKTYQAIPDLKFLDDLSILGIFVEPTVPGDQAPDGGLPSTKSPGPPSVPGAGVPEKSE